MPTWPSLGLVIPAHPQDWLHLTRLLYSLDQQTYPKEQLELHVITEGNSEEAKALGIAACRTTYIGFFCTDNVLLGPDCLQALVTAATGPGITGAFTCRYAYVQEDAALSRYFALLGANDPLCWWLGKADRASYLLSPDTARRRAASEGSTRTISYRHPLPSLGDNGVVFKTALIKSVLKHPFEFGSCMCMAQDLYAKGHATYAILSSHAIWHRSGVSLSTYLKKRWRYVNELYWERHTIRRWHMVETPREQLLCVLFALASLVLVPHLLVSIYGYTRKRDWAWFWHPVICLALTGLYTASLLRLRWRSVRWNVQSN